MKIFFRFNVSLMLCAAVSSLSYADSEVRKVRCDKYMFLEQDAIAKGLGKHVYYDTLTRSVMSTEVRREIAADGKAQYFVDGLAEDSSGESEVNCKSPQRFLDLDKTVVLDLRSLSLTDRPAAMSVFDLFTSEGASNSFGKWAGEYLNTAKIPRRFPEDGSIGALPLGISLPEGKKGLHVREKMIVIFEDGDAHFQIAPSGKAYRYTNGTAKDAGRRTVPSRPEEAVGRYTFADRSDPSYLGFIKIMLAHQVNLNSEGWSCVDSEGHEKEVVCRLSGRK